MKNKKMITIFTSTDSRMSGTGLFILLYAAKLRSEGKNGSYILRTVRKMLTSAMKA